MTIDLLLFGSSVPWTLGRTLAGPANPRTLYAELTAWLATTTADALLMWDARLGAPDPAHVQRLLTGRGDLWHAGLLLGANGQPGMIDFVAPNWTFNCDPPAERECTSWRATASACLVRVDVLRQLGLPCGDFDTIAGAMLEWGHRVIYRGALMRHVPALIPADAAARANFAADVTLTIADELRFVAYRYGFFWGRWAAGRAALSGYAAAADLLRGWSQLPSARPYENPKPYKTSRVLGAPDLANAKVTVLIPTLDRYPYLHVMLENLREQTVRAHEIIIIDQTKKESRDLTIAEKFKDLPLVLIYQDEPGQCASRNEGLRVSTGDFILFVDDDDELPPTLIADHLTNLAKYDADVSSGVVQELGTDRLPEAQWFVRSSDVFPTNNTLVRRDVLRRSGLFDLAFNRAPRADGELGMRVYQSGAFMVLDQGLSCLHHHAPAGGLRVHKARVITYRSSRAKLTQRHLPHISEIYLTARHFTQRQRREMLWLRTFGTLSAHGSLPHRLAKAVVGGVMLPDTLKQTLARRDQAAEWLQRFPQIAALDS